MASVAIKGGIENWLTMRPVNAPERVQTMTPAKEAIKKTEVPASAAPPIFSIMLAATTADKAIILPTDKSIPAVMMTIVMPIARMAMTAIWLVIFLKFTGVRNTGHKYVLGDAKIKSSPLIRVSLISVELLGKGYFCSPKNESKTGKLFNDAVVAMRSIFPAD